MQSLLDTWLDDVPSVPVLAHLETQAQQVLDGEGLDSLLDTWVDDIPSVSVLAHLKRKLSKS